MESSKDLELAKTDALQRRRLFKHVRSLSLPEPERVDLHDGSARLDHGHILHERATNSPFTTFRNTMQLGSSDRCEVYLIEVSRALMMYGAPTHRLEEYACHTAEALGLQLQSFYIPGCFIISVYDNTQQESPRVHMVRCTEALVLSKLYEAHTVYKDVIHKKTTVEQAIARLDKITTETDVFPRWVRILMYGLASACIGPVSYGARPIDLPIIFLLGSLLGFMELFLVQRSELYAHVFEISGAIVISLLARAFGSIPVEADVKPCFSAICQASLVMILPGLTITKSALELQSRNMVSGSVRMVYGVIFVLFLAFGVTIGATIYGAIDSAATSDTTCASTWPFWWQATFVPLFVFCYIVVNQGKWAKMPAMIIIAVCGWFVNHFAARRFSANAQITQALGALTVGILANLCSRVGHGLAIALLHPAIYLQVPGSFAASGSLISGLESANQLIHNTTATMENIAAHTEVLNAGYSMIEIAIGITVGLSVSALIVYPVRKVKGKSGMFTF
jgi:uncharacterized membrane protein YjjP (DUF1212 family)